MQIFVKTLSNDTVTVEVQLHDTILNVKAKVKDKNGMSIDEQNLLYNGDILQNHRLVSEYNIKKEATLCLVKNLQNGTRVFIKMLNGRSLTLLVNPTDNVLQLKTMIYDKEKLMPAQQRLAFAGKQLEDHMILGADCKILPDCTIHMLECVMPRPSFQIFICSLNGQTLTIDISPEDKVEVLKKKVQDKLGIDPEEQRLTFAGKQFEDEHLLKHYNIQRNCNVQLVQRLLGGNNDKIG